MLAELPSPGSWWNELKTRSFDAASSQCESSHPIVHIESLLAEITFRQGGFSGQLFGWANCLQGKVNSFHLVLLESQQVWIFKQECVPRITLCNGADDCVSRHQRATLCFPGRQSSTCCELTLPITSPATWNHLNASPCRRSKFRTF